jgi:hypothetical protein
MSATKDERIAELTRKNKLLHTVATEAMRTMTDEQLAEMRTALDCQVIHTEEPLPELEALKVDTRQPSG